MGGGTERARQPLSVVPCDPAQPDTLSDDPPFTLATGGRPITKFAAFEASDAAVKMARLSDFRIPSYPEQAIMRRSTAWD